MRLRRCIQQIALLWPSYGTRRVTKQLRRQGETINRKRVQRLMREDNLLCLGKKKFVKTTNSEHELPVYPNLAAGMELTGINQLWQADITYIRLMEEFIYLAVILDSYSRRVIGWALESGPFKFEVQQHLTELRIPPVVSDNQALFAGGH